ncbi:MAG TPA: STAS domain-containing protein [Candidatus Kapabacteria bacterium]
MNFTIEQDERGTIFRPKEPRLDSIVASELKAEFLILAQPDVEKLIIDLSDVEYIDSAGLSALLLARRQMSAHESDVRLVGVRPEVRSLLSLTQLDRVFGIYETTEEALNAPQLSATIVSPFGLATAGAAVGASTLAGIMMADGGEDDLDEDDDDLEDVEDDDDYEYDEDDEDEVEEVVEEKKEGTAVESDEEEDDDLAYEEDDDVLEEPFDDDYDEDEDEEDDTLVI